MKGVILFLFVLLGGYMEVAATPVLLPQPQEVKWTARKFPLDAVELKEVQLCREELLEGLKEGQEHIDFITGQFRNLMLQLLYRQIPPPHIVHKSSDAERRPICHLTPRQILLFARLFNHLPQRLKSPISSSVCHRFYPYPREIVPL